MLAEDNRSNLTTWCPLVDAIHLRNFAAMEVLMERMTTVELRECLWEVNVDGETVLHVVARSKANGFGRFFVRHILGKEDPASLVQVMNLLRIAPAAAQHLKKSVTLAQLERALSTDDAHLLLEAGGNIILNIAVRVILRIKTEPHSDACIYFHRQKNRFVKRRTGGGVVAGIS
jgi:hypothetical protein